MLRFMLSRLFQAVLTLFVISIVVFCLARISGDPRDLLLPDYATQEDFERLGEQLGLDKPYPIQYLTFISSVLRGDFGESPLTRQPVGPTFFNAMGNSMKLIFATFPIAILLSIPLAMIAAVKVGTIWSRLVMFIAVVGQSAPAFFIGLVLILLFSVHWGILPAARMTGPSSYILPGISLMFYTLAAQTRILRNSLLRAFTSDYIKLIRLKGAKEFTVWKHALRNGCIAMITSAAQTLARLVVGAVVVETVFAWPGAGRLIYQGIMQRDYAVIQTSVMVICFMMVLASLLVDILHAYIDPRIRVF